MNYRTCFICWQSGKVKQKSLIFQQGSHRNALSSPNPNLVKRTVGQQHLGTGWVTLPGHMCIVMKDMAPRTDFPGYPRAPALARWGKHLFCLLKLPPLQQSLSNSWTSWLCSWGRMCHAAPPGRCQSAPFLGCSSTCCKQMPCPDFFCC